MVSAVVFILLSFILASTRFSSRLTNLFGHFRPFAVPAVVWPGPRPLTTATMAPTRYRNPPQPPPTFVTTPSSIIDDTNRLIEKSRGVQDGLVKNISPDSATFGNTLKVMAQDDNEVSLEANIIGFYSAVSTAKELRDASTDAEKLFSDFGIESSMREDVFKLVDEAFKKKTDLDPESQRLLEKEHRAYLQNGLGIPAGPQRDRFKEIKKRLSDISITFQKNLNEENGGVWVTKEELDGVPKDLVDGFEKGEGENEGKIRVTFKYPDLFPTLKYAKNEEIRRQLFIQNENKCNENVPLFREAVLLRDEAARLLGYANWATFRLEDKMLKKPKTVDDFLDDLRVRLAPMGAKELDVLRDLKKANLGSEGSTAATNGDQLPYFLWDHRYYSRLMVEKDYELDSEKLSEFFPLSTTIEGMLKIFETLFGLVFVELTGEERDRAAPSNKGSDIVWHEDVQVFSVWDDEGQGSGFVGYLYLDLFPREGKYGHAANFNLQPGFIDKQGNRRYPATALVCNFSKPSKKKPSLLKHDEVVTLFHELGHGIHDLVGRTIYSRFHGTNTVRDFVEAPSQMLENWCWTPSQLRSLSHHYSYLSPEYNDAFRESNPGTEPPPKIIPDDLIEKLVRTKHVNDALANLRQLHFGTFDMLMHEPKSHEDLENLDISEKYNQMRKDISKIDGPEVQGEGYHWGNGEATFGHLIGGYDAGYYGYMRYDGALLIND